MLGWIVGSRGWGRFMTVGALTLVLAGCTLPLSSDPFTNAGSQHKTQVEPDTFSFGSTIVSAFQSGRFFDGGASDIGWATSIDRGQHWTHGFLAGITKYHGAGPYDRASDPSIAYDARHGVWLISALGLTTTSTDVLVSRSTDGRNWSNSPVTVAAPPNASLDKNWTVCDNTASSPHYGNCYTQYDDFGAGDILHMTTSSDGGLTWHEAVVPTTNAFAGQPVVQPNGTVIVPMDDAFTQRILSVRSTDGGATYGAAVTVANVSVHPAAGALRSGPLPSAEVDGAGKVYVVWQDCRFRSGCNTNDIVLSTSTNGTTWSAVTRIPIDPTTSTADHFIPGLGVDKATSGSSARLALAYYFYPDANCSSSTCELDVGFVSSVNGGASWSAASQLAGPMSLAWIANTSQGSMVGDYISTSFSGANAFPVFVLASAPSGGALNEAATTIGGGLPVSGGAASGAADRPVANSPLRPPTQDARARSAR